MLENSAIIALTVLFIHACTWDGMIFSFVKNLIDPDLSIAKPVYSCPICMTPYYGVIIYCLFIRLSFPDAILTIGAASGFSVISVVLLYIKDYCKSRARKEGECC